MSIKQLNIIFFSLNKKNAILTLAILTILKMKTKKQTTWYAFHFHFCLTCTFLISSVLFSAKHTNGVGTHFCVESFSANGVILNLLGLAQHCAHLRPTSPQCSSSIDGVGWAWDYMSIKWTHRELHMKERVPCASYAGLSSI